MATWKLPKKAKVYEALSAVADGRVKIKMDCTAEVTSSNGDKAYTVRWSDDWKSVGSNDNASYWQGYMGYPILAVLMRAGRLTYSADIASQLAGIRWKELNKKVKNDYDRAVESVLSDLQTRGISREAIVSEVDQIYDQLEPLGLQRMASSPPPK